MRSLLALLLAALLLLVGLAGVAAKPWACRKYKINADQFVWDIVPKCMPGYSLRCSGSCRSHLRKVNLSCFSALIKERMPQRLSGSIRFYNSCAKS